MNKPDYWLSLCIPTYNRADVLDKTLEVLFSMPDFDPLRIEVVVSDNASTDHTPQVAAKYPLVRYFRNEENVRDANFSLALLRGEGEYLKLMNDTVLLCPGGLGWMLDRIEHYRSSGEALLLYQRGHVREKCCRTVGELVAYTSFRATWIGNFGVWRRDLEVVKETSGAACQLLQVDWSYRLAETRPVRICCNHFCDVAFLPAQGRDPYHVFRVFVVNFLALGHRYLGTSHMTRWQFESSKHKIFSSYLCPRVVWLLFGSNQITHFDNRDSWRIILKAYGWYPYFYLEVLWKGLKYLIKGRK